MLECFDISGQFCSKIVCHSENQDYSVLKDLVRPDLIFQMRDFWDWYFLRE